VDKILRYKVLVILTVVVAIIATGGLVYAALSMNQTVGLTIEVNNPPGGEGIGGPIPTPSPTSTYIYQDSALSKVLTNLLFIYNQGGNASVTAYVKADEVPTIPTVTHTILGFTINATFGATTGNVKELIITASGGDASPVPYSGNATFTGS
jgi:hypothetical protein